MRRRWSILTILALVAAAALTSPAPAYVHRTLDFVGGTAIVAHWPDGAFPIPFRATRGLTNDILDGSDRAALEAAMATWSSVSDSDASMVLEGVGEVEANVLDGINAIEFSNDSSLQGSGFLALSFLNTAPDGRILEADMLVNDRANGFTTSAGARIGLDLETVMLRELGKLLGLANSPLGALESDRTVDEDSAVMFVQPRGVGETARELTPDDVAAIAALYPRAGSDRGVVSGRVTRTQEPVFGAQVVVFEPRKQLLISGLSLPDGSFRIAGLPTGTYFLEVVSVSEAELATIGGIFARDTAATGFRRSFLDELVEIEPGGSVEGLTVEVQ